MSKQTFVGIGVAIRNNVEYHIRPNQLSQTMTRQHHEWIESRIAARLETNPTFTYAYFNDDLALVVGLRADRQHDHVAVLKRILDLLVQNRIHNPRAGVNTKVPGLS